MLFPLKLNPRKGKFNLVYVLYDDLSAFYGNTVLWCIHKIAV